MPIKNTLNEEICEEFSERFMEKILDMINHILYKMHSRNFNMPKTKNMR
jgi:predicted house-cleaning noncanonical NTP pyrophosphatase (MazG superfamily)